MEGFAFGIYTEGNLNGSISGNRARGLVGDAYGIVNSLSGQIRVRNNDVSGDYSTPRLPPGPRRMGRRHRHLEVDVIDPTWSPAACATTS